MTDQTNRVFELRTAADVFALMAELDDDQRARFFCDLIDIGRSEFGIMLASMTAKERSGSLPVAKWHDDGDPSGSRVHVKATPDGPTLATYDVNMRPSDD